MGDCGISQNSVAFDADYVKVVKDRYMQQNFSPSNNLVFSDISLVAIFTEVTENECIIISEVIYC